MRYELLSLLRFIAGGTLLGLIVPGVLEVLGR